MCKCIGKAGWLTEVDRLCAFGKELLRFGTGSLTGSPTRSFALEPHAPEAWALLQVLVASLAYPAVKICVELVNLISSSYAMSISTRTRLLSGAKGVMLISTSDHPDHRVRTGGRTTEGRVRLTGPPEG
jgi:hypothetical protein